MKNWNYVCTNNCGSTKWEYKVSKLNLKPVLMKPVVFNQNVLLRIIIWG